MAEEFKFHYTQTPIEMLISYTRSHPEGCHCTACAGVRRLVAEDDKLMIALRKVHDLAESVDDLATEAKHDSKNHNEPEMWYQQGRADAARIILATIHETLSREDLGL